MQDHILDNVQYNLPNRIYILLYYFANEHIPDLFPKLNVAFGVDDPEIQNIKH